MFIIFIVLSCPYGLMKNIGMINQPMLIDDLYGDYMDCTDA